MGREILVTYFKGDGYGYDWLEDDEDVEDWLAENKDVYTQIEIIRVTVTETIYESKEV